jgi:hypothetical protein
MTLQVFLTRTSLPNRDPRMMTTNLMCQGSREVAVDPIVVGEDEAAAEAIAKAEAAAEVKEEAVAKAVEGDMITSVEDRHCSPAEHAELTSDQRSELENLRVSCDDTR